MTDRPYIALLTWRIGAASVVVASMACGDPLVDPQAIVDMRVLGASAAVVGDEPRATPSAGEEVSVQWLVAGPEGTLPVQAEMIVCRSRTNTVGAPECTQEIERFSFAAATDLSFSFTAPSDLEGDRLAVVGIVCESGKATASIDVESGRCDDDGKATKSYLEIYPRTETFQNDNPAWATTAAAFNDLAWPNARPGSSGGPDADCEDGVLPTVVADGSTHRITLDVAGLRESLPDTEREALEIAHYVTAGSLERHYSAVEGTTAEPPRPVELSWQAPPRLKDSTMTFYAVARDGRGGVSFIERTLCITEANDQ